VDDRAQEGGDTPGQAGALGRGERDAAAGDGEAAGGVRGGDRCTVCEQPPQ
jgi:hypothetical protein